MENPFSISERGERVRFFRLGEVVDRDAMTKLTTVVGERGLQELLNLHLESPEAREIFVQRFLGAVASGLDGHDEARIVAGLVGIGAGVASLTATEHPADKVSFFGSDAHLDSTGKYLVLLGSGTGGQRILLSPRPPKEGGGFQRLLVFPSQGERISGKHQRAFQLLLGSRVQNLSPTENDPHLVASIVDDNGIDFCPCHSGKKWNACHGSVSIPSVPAKK